MTARYPSLLSAVHARWSGMFAAHRWLAASVAIGVIAVAVGAAPASQGRRTPPLVIDSIAGEDSFQFYCASCHGKAGKGDGPTAVALKIAPTDLTSLARLNGGAFPRDRVRASVTGVGRPIAAHGSSEMPVWGAIFRALDPSDARVRLRIEAIVARVEALQEPTSAPQGLGARLFLTYCASCHGRTGKGDGPAAGQFRQPPPDLTTYTERNGGVFPTDRVHEIVDGRNVRAHGDREMPVWGDAFKSAPDGLPAEAVNARIAAIVAYLRAVQQRDTD